jgi:hypothetical protein
MILLSLLILLTIIVNIMVIYLVKQREQKDCECSNVANWKRNYIKYYSVIAIILLLFVYIIPIWLKLFKLQILGESIGKLIKSNPFQFLLSIFIAFGFFNLYFIFKYTKQLENTKCNCENKQEKILRQVLNYYSIIVITIYIITTLLAFSIKLK